MLMMTEEVSFEAQVVIQTPEVHVGQIRDLEVLEEVQEDIQYQDREVQEGQAAQVHTLSQEAREGLTRGQEVLQSDRVPVREAHRGRIRGRVVQKGQLQDREVQKE